MKVVFDTNIWISFFFGKNFSILPEVLKREDIEVYVSDELIAEIKQVVSRPKFSRIITTERLALLLSVIDEHCSRVENYASIASDVRDPKDLYLISMVAAIPADYLVTGDKDLLVLVRQGRCKIITFAEFRASLRHGFLAIETQ